MGLDMYAYSVRKGILEDADQVDVAKKLYADGQPLEGVDGDFAYWRKFNHLHGWMESLYRAKGGKDDDFNCSTVRVMPEDIDRLESMAKMKALPAKGGFFFGDTNDFNDEDKEEVLEFVEKARKVFADGGAIVYDSWW
jgi:hypothetical protein